MVSREVVQPLPSTGNAADALNSALQRLAANPRDAGALVDAGFAALEIGDVDAAVGFFSRADAVSPGNPRAQAGLGAAYVRSENPYDALLMFEEAEKGGVAPVTMAGDRGLAYDLVGDAASAQLYYRQALTVKPDAEIARRLAISQAISGDGKGAEATLLPLLKKQDLAAYRARAFVLAIQGDAKGAQDIADQVMPREMAGKIAPYLRYMPRLTAAQQAAAANFGQFPRAADIGKDDPRVAKYSGNAKRPSQVASAAPAAAQSALVPAGEPFGRKAGSEKPAKAAKRDRREDRQPAAAVTSAAPSVAQPIAQRAASARVTETGELPPVTQARTAVASVAVAPSLRSLSVPTATPAPAPSPVATAPRATVIAAAPVSPAINSAPAAAYAPPPAAPAYAATPTYSSAPSVPGGEAAIASFGIGQQVAQTGLVTAAPPGAAATASPLAAPVQATPVATTPAFAAQAAMPAPASPAAASLAVAPPVTAQPVAEPTMPAPPAQPEPLPNRLADAFADFSLPSAVQRAPGAVDITKITPRREAPLDKDPPEDPKAAKDSKVAKDPKDAKAQAADAKAKKNAKPKAPPQPSRAWVQVATGRDTKALAFDWRRMTKAQAALFKGRQPYVAKWGQTNRLLTGPFPNAAAAQDYVAKLKKAGVDSFTFTSDEGEEVSALNVGN